MANTTSARASASAFIVILLVCLGLLGYGLYLQHVLDLDPCPWCVVQRLHFIAIALVALVAALHRPKRAGAVVYSVLGALFALGGMAAAGYHVHIQSDPRRALECMGGWLERWLDASKLGKMVPPLLQYDGSCIPKAWSFMGLSIPEWAFVWFAILLVAFAIMMYRSRR